MGRFNRFFPSSLWQFGTYPVKLCADIRDVCVKERNERNNCRILTRYHLYIVPRTLDGNVSGTLNLDGWKETWTGDVHLHLVQDDNTSRFGAFDYTVDERERRC